MLRLALISFLVTLISIACVAPKPQALPAGTVIIKKTAGLPITGSAYGQGETAVILASQAGTSGSQWAFFAKYLADAGMTVVTLSSPEGQGETVVLVGQAISFLREKGYKRIFCAGASNGASGCAFNAAEPEITGLLLLTYHGAANLSISSLPKLFVVGEQADPWRSTAELGFNKAAEPKKLILVPETSFTGPSILEIKPEIKDEVLAFIKKCNGL